MSARSIDMDDRKPDAPTPLTPAAHSAADSKLGAEPGSAPEQKRARDRRNVAIALGLVAFAVLLFLITLVQFDAPDPASLSGGTGE